MSKTKILENLTIARTGRRGIQDSGMVTVGLSLIPADSRLVTDMWEYRIEVQVGARLLVPEEEKHRQYIHDAVVSNILNELYGDLHRRLLALRVLLHTERYRPHDDQVLAAVNDLLRETTPDPW